MIKYNKKEDCCGCYACVAACPQNCIVMKKDEEGFSYPEVNIKPCVNCRNCENVCPILKEDSSNGESELNILAYAAINKNEEVRSLSSSGGIFSLLAEFVLAQNGYVFGAAYTDNFRSVKHAEVHTIDELEKLRGSKYLQSEIGDIYVRIKDILEEGKLVLFTGTPCQVEGLRSFLCREYPNLICLDIICHGVPSPLVWEKYIDFQEERYRDSVRHIHVRSKRKYGWHSFAVLLKFSDKKVYECVFREDLFMQAFLQNSCLRPSCYQCKFKKLKRKSDLTLADFWGVEHILPEMDDDKGTSLLIIQSLKGRDLFEKIKKEGNIIYQKIDIKKAIRFNSAAIESVKANSKRKMFFDNLDVLPFSKLVKRYAKPKHTLRGIAAKGLRKLGLK